MTTSPCRGSSRPEGAIKVKGTGDEVAQIVRSEQVARYVACYGPVLVTNYRDFALVGQN